MSCLLRQFASATQSWRWRIWAASLPPCGFSSAVSWAIDFVPTSSAGGGALCPRSACKASSASRAAPCLHAAAMSLQRPGADASDRESPHPSTTPSLYSFVPLFYSQSHIVPLATSHFSSLLCNQRVGGASAAGLRVKLSGIKKSVRNARRSEKMWRKSTKEREREPQPLSHTHTHMWWSSS